MYLSVSQTKDEIKSAVTYVFISNLPSFSPPWNAVADLTPQGEKISIITTVRQYGLKQKALPIPKGSQFIPETYALRHTETQNSDIS